MGARLRVVQVSFYADAQQRDAESLLVAWPTLSGVAAGVARADVEIVVVQAAHSNRTIHRDGVDYFFIDDRRRIPSRVIDRVTSLHPDVVHVHGFHHALAVRQLARACRVPVLVQDHGSLPPTGWRASAWRWAFGSTAGAAFTAKEQIQPWVRAGILRAELPTFEALEGSSHFTPGDRGVAQQQTGMSGDPCCLWTSRLDANKDPLIMLSAFESAALRLSDARLWCCYGRSPLLDTVRRRIEESDILRERVTLLGHRPHTEMEQLFRAADFYLQTSHREGSGYSLIEALACGTTPIVTDIPASRRIVGDAGSLTPLGDAPAMADALVQWSRRERTSLREAARARFDAALSFDVIGLELRAAYEALGSSCVS